MPLLWFYFASPGTKFISKILKLAVVLGVLTSLYGVYQASLDLPSRFIRLRLVWLFIGWISAEAISSRAENTRDDNEREIITI